MKKAVYIEGPFAEYAAMYEEMGWRITLKFSDAHLIQFTGGADVGPGLYGEAVHDKTVTNPPRDIREQKIFRVARAWGTPMAGICRGGQFLNVMCGGSLYQHVDGHAITGTHKAIDIVAKEEFQVTSTHHQIMKPSNEGRVLVVARESTKKERIRPGTRRTITVFSQTDDDVEVVWYPADRCFCFQPHPEYPGHTALRDRYVAYIEKYLFSEWKEGV